jgi:hypothetical protein
VYRYAMHQSVDFHHPPIHSPVRPAGGRPPPPQTSTCGSFGRLGRPFVTLLGQGGLYRQMESSWVCRRWDHAETNLRIARAQPRYRTTVPIVSPVTPRPRDTPSILSTIRSCCEWYYCVGRGNNKRSSITGPIRSGAHHDTTDEQGNDLCGMIQEKGPQSQQPLPNKMTERTIHIWPSSWPGQGSPKARPRRWPDARHRGVFPHGPNPRGRFVPMTTRNTSSGDMDHFSSHTMKIHGRVAGPSYRWSKPLFLLFLPSH